MEARGYDPRTLRLSISRRAPEETVPLEEFNSYGGLTRFQIWAEGYAATGDSGGAMFLGEVWAKTFKEACDLYFKSDALYKGGRYWGCRLFPSEEEARRSFG